MDSFVLGVVDSKCWIFLCIISCFGGMLVLEIMCSWVPLSILKYMYKFII